MKTPAALFALSMTMPALAGGLPPAPTGVQVTHDHGVEFVTVTDAGNTGYPKSTRDWTGIPTDRQGRGAVAYDYRIARTEVTSAQWLEFLNTFSPRPMPEHVRAHSGLAHDFYLGPIWSGMYRAEADPVAGTSRFELRTDTPDAADIPVWSLSWRMAAVYCNWLHNGKSSDWSALLSGAYDTGTWSVDPETGAFSDRITRETGARYWIPTLDEWGKAVFYDPNRNGPGEGGWWDRHYGSDDLPVPGLPGDPGAQTSTGVPITGPFGEIGDIPLGSYAAMSPWGLFDTAGGTTEIVAEFAGDPDEARRYSVLTLGAYAGSPGETPEAAYLFLETHTRAFAGATAGIDGGFTVSGLRIAAAVPGPSTLIAVGLLGFTTIFSRRRTKCDSLLPPSLSS